MKKVTNTEENTVVLNLYLLGRRLSTPAILLIVFAIL
jgi:hypothetical protein